MTLMPLVTRECRDVFSARGRCAAETSRAIKRNRRNGAANRYARRDTARRGDNSQKNHSSIKRMERQCVLSPSIIIHRAFALESPRKLNE